MDEFLSQFLIESREQVEEAIDALLAIEKNPDDRDRFDEAFRAFHTLKGGAGIVEFGAMQQALHCAEDVLAATRSHSAPLSASDIGACLMCLDQIVEWLDAIETTGALPRNADAGAVIARFGRSATPRETAPKHEWAASLLGSLGVSAKEARSAVRYAPDAEIFYRHEDPLGRIAALPGLLAIAVEPRAPWPPLDELDPFSCNLTIAALSSSPSTELAAALGDAIAHSEIAELLAAPTTEPRLAQQARELLSTQLRMLDGERLEAGQIASAGLVAANVLRHVGRRADAERIAAVTDESIARAAPDELKRALATVLEGAPTIVPHVAGRRERTLRVAAPRIDALVRLTGELTVAKNAIGHAVKLAERQAPLLAPTLKQRHESLERLVGEVQRSVLSLRVLPLRAAFQRLPRLVREMAAELGKPATLLLEGEETEADKAVVEILGEPLVHVLRNAMDHGIEDEAARQAAGKPPVATIRLRAARDGDRVLIEVIDDGRGIDVARVREVARERNVVPAETLASMSDAEAIDLIFAPGFSTARAVTGISGRGVGLDAVRTAVKRLGGHVGVGESSSSGTTVRLTVPFSIMMTDVMTVEAGGQTFGIPLEAVVETLRVTRREIVPVGAAHAMVLRGRTVPVVELAQILGARPVQDDGDSALVVITEVDDDVGALAVRRIGERMPVMLKPLDGILSGLPGIAGSTLLGDGSVLLVLDVAELLQ
jgi:two-component system, chemotaxis family, sensor kinase CheA